MAALLPDPRGLKIVLHKYTYDDKAVEDLIAQIKKVFPDYEIGQDTLGPINDPEAAKRIYDLIEARSNHLWLHNEASLAPVPIDEWLKEHSP